MADLTAKGVTDSAPMRIVPAKPNTPFPANPQLGDFFVTAGVSHGPLPPPFVVVAHLWFFANVPADTPGSYNGWVQIV